ncbi:MAG: SurA N-terminal domain-containing protein [Myxococcota bacterium]|nr:SurA N-terminal domain-containing protein [Myxococcota bacterium]
MLTDLREKSQSFLIYILFGILIIVFIFFFGPQAEGCQPGAPAARNLNAWAARVDGTEVSMREVEIAVRRQALFEQDFDDDRAAISRLRREKLEQVIDQTLVENAARKMGIAVDSKSLSKYIVSEENPDFPLFRDREGKFDRGSYRDQLQQVLGATPEAYRRVKERELIIRRYLDFLASQVAVSEAEVKADYDNSERSWNLEYIVFDPKDYQDKIQPVTSEEGAAYAAKAANETKAYYEANKSNYVRDKEIKIRRILIRKPKLAAKVADAKKKAEDALVKARAEGADFAKLAEELSEGAYKNYQGLMGWQSSKNTRDYTVYSKLKKGEISALQTDDIGFWFVKADDVREAIDRKLDDVKGEIGTTLLSNQRREKKAMQAAKSALAQAKTVSSLTNIAPSKSPESDLPNEAETVEGDNPEAAKEEATADSGKTLDVKTTGPIQQGRISELVPGIGRSADLARRIPSLDDKNPLVSEVLKVGQRLVVVRLKNRVEPDAKKFEDARRDIEQRLKRSRQMHLFGSWRAILYGPSQQRKTFSQLGSSALMSLLKDRSKVKVNEGEFALIPPTPNKDTQAPR